MAQLTVTNKNSAIKRIIAFGAIALFGYIGIRGIDNYFDNRPLRQNARKVRHAIKDKDFNLAESYLKSFTPSKDLKQTDYLELKASLAKGEMVDSVDKYIDAGKLDYAKHLVRANDVLSSDEKTSLEQKIYSASDDGLFESFSKADNDYKKDNCIEYLTKFPEGKHTKDAAGWLVEDQLDLLLGRSSSMSAEKLYSEIQDFNTLLEQYKDKGINLEEPKSVEGRRIRGLKFGRSMVTEMKKNILDTLALTPISSIADLSVDMNVVVKEKSDYDSYDAEYVKERNNAIPLGSTGKIVGANMWRENVYVVFENVDTSYWSRDWKGPATYWRKDGKRNVAEYKISELGILRSMTPEDQEILLKQLEIVNDMLTKYYIGAGKK